MKPVVISRQARADLREIGDFIGADNPKRVESFVADIRARCQALGHRPMIGRPAPEIAPDVRLLVFRAYPTLHRVREDRILIDRVLHAARDRSRLPPHA